MSCGEFVGGLLHGVTVAHVFHLRSRSYSEHMALGSLYEGLGGLADSLAEAYQGSYGLIDDYPASFDLPDGEPKTWLAEFSRFVQASRGDVGEDSELQNICDEIQALIDSTMYKLTFLR